MSDAGSVAPGAARLVRRLVERGETVALAESLTGGLVVAELVGVPGASAVVRGAVVAYMTDLKTTLLGVPTELLDRVGAVDGDVAAAMAVGASERLGATYGVATTGVAGPDPQDGHPVGDVWLAVHASGRGVRVRHLELEPALGRAGIRRAAVDAALVLLGEVVGD